MTDRSEKPRQFCTVAGCEVHPIGGMAPPYCAEHWAARLWHAAHGFTPRPDATREARAFLETWAARHAAVTAAGRSAEARGKSRRHAERRARAAFDAARLA